MSGSESGSGSQKTTHTQTPARADEPEPKRWTADSWYRKFGYAWAAAKGRIAYGRGSETDAKARGALGDILDSLGPEADRAQELAPEMFRMFLADDGAAAKAQHPWSWFVTRFNGLLTLAMNPKAAAPKSVAPTSPAAHGYPEIK